MKKAIMTTDIFNRLINATKGFTGSFGSRYIHQFIRLEFHSDSDEVVAVAVDGFKLSVEHAVCKSEEDFVVYVKSNAKLPRKTKVEIELDGNEALFRCDEFVFGYQQPDGEFCDWKKVLPKGEPSFKIGFNAEYLLKALDAARISAGGICKTACVLEFRSPLEPVIIRTNSNDIKMVLPVRLTD